MSNRIKDAFDEIKVEDSLKENTKAFIYSKTNGYQQRYRNKQLKFSLSALVLMLISGSFYTYFTPVAAISVEGNSSVELKVNRFNKVIAVEEYSNSGEVVSSTVNVEFKDYNQVIDEMLEETRSFDDNKSNEVVAITVLCDDEEKNQEILTHVEQCRQVIENQKNVHCYSGNSELAKEAHNHGMATGKYRAYLELQEQNPNIEVENVEELSMRDIYTIMRNQHEEHHDDKREEVSELDLPDKSMDNIGEETVEQMHPSKNRPIQNQSNAKGNKNNDNHHNNSYNPDVGFENRPSEQVETESKEEITKPEINFERPSNENREEQNSDKFENGMGNQMSDITNNSNKKNKPKHCKE